MKAVLSCSLIEWANIAPILPAISERLHGYDIGLYAGYTEKDVDDFYYWLRKRHINGVPLRQRLMDLVKTARMLVENSRKNGDIESYLSDRLNAHSGNLVMLVSEMAVSSEHKFHGLRFAGAAEALKNVGYDVAKSDRHVDRALACFAVVCFDNWPEMGGYGKPKTRQDEHRHVMMKMQDFADSLGEDVNVTLLENAIWLLCSTSGPHLTNEQLWEMRARLD